MTNEEKYIKPLKFRIDSLKEQLKLMNEKPDDFILLKPEIEARLDELETLLEYYKKN